MDKLKRNIEKRISKNIIYLILSNPAIYLKKLLKRTLGIGLLVFIISYVIHVLNLDGLTIPSAMHSVIGLVIGFLLVFRTNTAYDRWWEGRKTIGYLSQEISVISARLNVIDIKSKIDVSKTLLIRECLSDFVSVLHNYLSTCDDGKEYKGFHILQRDSIQKAILVLSNISVNDINVSGLNASLAKLLEHSINLERIKKYTNTSSLSITY